MKLFTLVKERHFNAIKDLKKKYHSQKIYLSIYWLIITMFVLESYPYPIRLFVGQENLLGFATVIGDLTIFALLQYLNSFIYGLHISEEEYEKVNYPKGASPYITYTQRSIFSFGVGFCGLTPISMFYGRNSGLFSSLGNALTILAIGITLLLWINTTAKETRQKHIEFKNKLEEVSNKKKVVEVISGTIHTSNEKLEEILKLSNQLTDTNSKVINQLALLNKEILTIKGAIEAKDKQEK